jgi:catechol 2,3-dioxygenase-like lactoylglutathione lyase family enzyme
MNVWNRFGLLSCKAIFLLLSLLTTAFANDKLPILRLAHVGFEVSDLDVSSRHYQQIFGLDTAFSVNGAAYLKVNDNQFIKLLAVGGRTHDNRITEIAFHVADIDKTEKGLKQRGLKPSNVYRAADGTLAIRLRDPEGHQLVFVEYVADSLQAKTQGQFLSDKRVSKRLQHIGITIRNEDAANAFYGKALGFTENWRASRTDDGPDAWVGMQLPGSSGNYIEYVLINDMQPNRQVLGNMHHVCLLSDNIHQSYQKLLEHGIGSDTRFKPRIGRSKRWLLNTHDPDGSRTELMEENEALTKD